MTLFPMHSMYMCSWCNVLSWLRSMS